MISDGYIVTEHKYNDILAGPLTNTLSVKMFKDYTTNMGIFNFFNVFG